MYFIVHRKFLGHCPSSRFYVDVDWICKHWPLIISLGVNDLWAYEADPHPRSLAAALNQLVTGGGGSSRDLQRQSAAPHLPE
jgi:hypothetical protein